jgi:hypothetical protein
VHEVPDGETHSRPTLLALLGLLLITGVCFHDSLFGGRVFFERDINLVWYPYIAAVKRSVEAGSLPLWNNFISFGEPLWANPNVQILYPFTWLAVFLTPEAAYRALVAFHTVFSGLGLFLLCRRLSVSGGSSFVASAAWILSGPFLSMVGLWHHLAGVAWLPWIILAMDRLAERPGVPRALTLSLAAAAQALAGSADACAMTALFGAGFLAFRLGLESVKPLLWAGVSWAIALGLAAAQWLPALDLALRTARWDLGNATRVYWSLHPRMFPQFLLPFRWDHIPPPLRTLFFEGREPLLSSLYLGLPALGLACLSFARPKRTQVFFALAAVASLALATGKFGPFHAIGLALLPPLRMLRFPVKVVATLAFSTAMLVGLGLDSLASWGGGRRRLAALGLAVPLLGAASIFGLRGSLSGLGYAEGGVTMERVPLALGLAVAACALPFLGLSAVLFRTAMGALLIADLLLAHITLNPTAPGDFYRYRPAVLDGIPRSGFPRIHVREYVLFHSQPSKEELSLYRLDLAGLDDSGIAVRKALSTLPSLYPPSGGRFGVETAYDWDILGLYPPFLSRLVDAVRASDGTPLFGRFLRTGGVSLVVSLQPLDDPVLSLVSTYPSLYPIPVHLYRVADPLARCSTVGASLVLGDAEALAALQDPSFDPSRTAVLAEGPALPGRGDFQGTCAIEALEPDTVRLRVQASAPAVVVLLDTFDPGWGATLDGAPTGVLRANLAFRGILVPAGSHEIRMAYRPRSVTAGGLISLACLAVALGGAVLGKGR